jgi:hypothetical protein
MASIGQGDKHYEGVAPSIGMLAAERGAEAVRQWWQAWRWPAGLLAGVVLWLALVAIAGAATPLGNGHASAATQSSAPARGS